MLDKTIEYYDNNSFKIANKYEFAKMTYLQKNLLSIFSVEHELLEIGCGSGRDAAFMFDNGYSIVAIDGSEEMIKEAKKRHPNIRNKLFKKDVLDELKFKKKFKGIFSIATLMHLTFEDFEKTVLKIYNLLDEQGIFLVSVSLKRNDINSKGFDKFGRYFLIMKKNEWLNSFKKVGFKVEEIHNKEDGLFRKNIIWLTLVLRK